jgi:hypothetical protein
VRGSRLSRLCGSRGLLGLCCRLARGRWCRRPAGRGGCLRWLRGRRGVLRLHCRLARRRWRRGSPLSTGSLSRARTAGGQVDSGRAGLLDRVGHRLILRSRSSAGSAGRTRRR